MSITIYCHWDNIQTDTHTHISLLQQRRTQSNVPGIHTLKVGLTYRNYCRLRVDLETTSFSPFRGRYPSTQPANRASASECRHTSSRASFSSFSPTAASPSVQNAQASSGDDRDGRTWLRGVASVSSSESSSRITAPLYSRGQRRARITARQWWHHIWQRQD